MVGGDQIGAGDDGGLVAGAAAVLAGAAVRGTDTGGVPDCGAADRYSG